MKCQRVRAQNILTGQRRGNESLPLKCCHEVALQERGEDVRADNKNSEKMKEIRFSAVFGG